MGGDSGATPGLKGEPASVGARGAGAGVPGEWDGAGEGGGAGDAPCVWGDGAAVGMTLGIAAP